MWSVVQGPLLFVSLLTAVVTHTKGSKYLQMLFKNNRLKKAECQESC